MIKTLNAAGAETTSGSDASFVKSLLNRLPLCEVSSLHSLRIHLERRLISGNKVVQCLQPGPKPEVPASGLQNVSLPQKTIKQRQHGGRNQTKDDESDLKIKRKT